MALEDFLGKTSEIKIFDFLAENGEFTYNQTEISECTGLSRTIVNQKIPDLIYNGLIEIKSNKGNVNYYQLADNKIVGKLIGAVFENSFYVAEYDDEENESLGKIREEVGPINYEEVNNCYFAYLKNEIDGENIHPYWHPSDFNESTNMMSKWEMQKPDTTSASA